MSEKFENNNRCQIYDLDNNLLVDDIIISCKDRVLMNPLNGAGNLISFDDKHFFNLNSQELVYKEIKDKNINFNKIKFDINNFKKYKMDMWHKICFDKELIDDTVVIYRENDINELDPEVKDLVNVINKLPCVNTVSSCSGHGTKGLFVGIKINSLGILEVLVKILYDNFNKLFILTTKPGYVQNGIGNGIICNIQTSSYGEEAYEQAKKLTKILEEYIKSDLINDYKRIFKTSNVMIEEIYEDIKFDKKELERLKNIFNKIKYIFVDMEEKYDEYNKPIIEMIFYDKKAIDEFLEILWNDFREDFVLKTNNNIRYVNIEKDNKGTCFTLEFVMPVSEYGRKIKMLSEVLLNKVTDWK